MAYFEALFYYIVIVFFVFVLTFIVLALISFNIRLFLAKKDYVGENNLTFSDQFVYIVKYKLLKIYTLIYASAFFFFLIIHSSEYFGSDRAYPKAKAYKIVADVSSFYFDFFIANRNLYYKPSGLKYIEPYEKWQAYLMKKAFTYIPKDDAERAIWRYEYYYANYVRARTAPIDFGQLDKVNLDALLKIGAHPTLYKPVAQEMIKEVGELLDILMKNSMQDKYYNEVNRYTTTILFSGWWENKNYLYYNLGAKNPTKWMDKKIQITDDWIEDKKYLSRIERLVGFFDKAKQQVENSKKLREFLKGHELIYPDLMALRVGLSANIAYVNLVNKDSDCEAYLLQKYLKNRKEFLAYTTKNISFDKFYWKKRINLDNAVNGNPNSELMHFLYRNCAIPRKHLFYKYGVLQDKILIHDEWEIDRLAKNTKN